MILYVKQRGNQYYIYEEKEGPVSFHGYWRRDRENRLHSKIFNVNNEEQLFVKVGKVPWIGVPKTYLLRIPAYATEIEVRLINVWRPHFQFQFGQSLYDFYCHAGHKKSLYKDNEQVAKYDKAIFKWAERDSGFMIANSDEDQMLVLGLFLMLDMGEENGADVTADFGNLLSGVKDWNEYWLPNR